MEGLICEAVIGLQGEMVEFAGISFLSTHFTV
jgi:hypothetical protein